MNKASTVRPFGALVARKISMPGPGLVWKLSNALRFAFMRGWLAFHLIAPLARAFGLAVAYGKLEAVLMRKDGTRVNYGVLGYRLVTDAFVAFVTDQLQVETSIFGDFKFHDSGVGVTAENAANMQLKQPTVKPEQPEHKPNQPRMLIARLGLSRTQPRRRSRNTDCSTM